MTHVSDDLELYVLGVLPPSAARRVADHVATCAECAEEARALEAAVSALHDTLPDREPPPQLRERILTSARPAPAVRAAAGDRLRPLRAWRRWAPAAAVAASILLAIVTAGALRQEAAMRAELAETRAIARLVSQESRSWYMSGVDRWKGAGGVLYAPKTGRAFVVFHDLPAAPPGQSYTIWLVDAEGRWVRGSSFTPGEPAVRMVEVGVAVEGFDRCAVTLESRSEGRREGPIVMQSRFY